MLRRDCAVPCTSARCAAPCWAHAALRCALLRCAALCRAVADVPCAPLPPACPPACLPACLPFSRWELMTNEEPWHDKSAMQVVGAVGWNDERLGTPEEGPPAIRELIDACFGEPAGRQSFRWAGRRCGEGREGETERAGRARCAGGVCGGCRGGQLTRELEGGPHPAPARLCASPRPAPGPLAAPHPRVCACSEIIPMLKGMIKAMGPPAGYEHH